jgi:hypothetical protein
LAHKNQTRKDELMFDKGGQQITFFLATTLISGYLCQAL